MDAVFFLTIYDDWGKKKLDYFQDQGLKTHVLWEVPLEKKGISAGDVRERMKRDDPWDHLVPHCVAELIKGWRVPERMRAIGHVNADRNIKKA
jgi:nicotinamide-nucleotide adenylyltransferase